MSVKPPFAQRCELCWELRSAMVLEGDDDLSVKGEGAVGLGGVGGVLWGQR